MIPSIIFLFHFLLKETKNNTTITKAFIMKPIVTRYLKKSSFGNILKILFEMTAIRPKRTRAI